MDTDTFDSVFWISFITIISGMILKLTSMCYKSKCKSIKICGGRMSCIRDTEAEEKIDEIELSRSPKTKDLGDLL